MSERLPIGDFFACVFDIVHQWSSDRDPDSPNCKPFVKISALKANVFSEAYDFAKFRGKTVKAKRVSPNQIRCYIPTNTKTNLTVQEIKTYHQKSAKFVYPACIFKYVKHILSA